MYGGVWPNVLPKQSGVNVLQVMTFKPVTDTQATVTVCKLSPTYSTYG